MPPGSAAVVSEREPGSNQPADRDTVSRLIADELNRQPQGAVCFEGRQCQSGLCEGDGCGKETPGVCVSPERPCSAQRETFCGCDGRTFIASATCPEERFAHRGACAATPGGDSAAAEPGPAEEDGDDQGEGDVAP